MSYTRAAAVTTSIGKTKGVSGPDVSSYPPPKHLKVPSGLTPEQVCSHRGDDTDPQIKTVSECLNDRIADAFALFVKTKNYHWHVTGSHFRGASLANCPSLMKKNITYFSMTLQRLFSIRSIHSRKESDESAARPSEASHRSPIFRPSVMIIAILMYRLAK